MNGFDQEEKLKYKSLVYSNTIESLNVILKAMHSLQIPFALSQTKLELEKFLSINFTNIDNQVAEIMKNIWLEECFSRSNEYQLNDSAK